MGINLEKYPRILFLQLYGGGRVVGGTEVYLKNLLKFLSQTWPEVRLVVATLNGINNIFTPYAERVVDVVWTRFIETWTVMRLQYQHNIFGLILLPMSVMSLVISGFLEIKRRQVKLIYANGGQVAAISAYMLHKLSGVPYVLHFHGMFDFSRLYITAKTSLLAAINVKIAQRFFSHSKIIIANSKDCYLDIVKARGTKNKISIVKCFVDETLFKPRNQKKSRKKLNLPIDSFIMVSTNRLEEGKHISLLLTAFHQVKSAKARLVIIGDGPLRSQVYKLQELDSRIIYLPQVPNDQLPIYLSAADIAWGVCSVYYMSLTQVEALACGVPVVSSDRPSPPDTNFTSRVQPATLPKDVGYLVKHEAQIIANLLDRLVGQRLVLQKRQTACREFYDTEYGRMNRDEILQIIKRHL